MTALPSIHFYAFKCTGSKQLLNVRLFFWQTEVVSETTTERRTVKKKSTVGGESTTTTVKTKKTKKSKKSDEKENISVVSFFKSLELRIQFISPAGILFLFLKHFLNNTRSFCHYYTILL